MIAIMEVLKYEKNELKKCSSNKIIFAAANMLVNKEKPEEDSIIKEIREIKEGQKIFKFEDNDKYSHIPFIGVPSGKCGFTTLRNFPDFLI